MADFLDFELGVTLLEDGQIALSVLNAPAGKGTATLPNPFSDGEVTRLLGMLDDSANASAAEEARASRAFGEKLHKWLFAGEIGTAYTNAIQHAGERGVRLCLNLDKAGTLVHWPWELLRELRGEHLAFSRQIIIARRGQVGQSRPIADISLPLRVLVMIAAPTDQPAFNVEAEWQALYEATADLRERGLLALERVENGQVAALQRKLRESKTCHIFHFIGHPAEDEGQGDMLALEDPRKRTTVPVSADDLVRELNQSSSSGSVRLAVLCSALTRRQDVRDPFWAMATGLIGKGMPAVVEMQYGLGESALKVFAGDFYRLLAEGFPVEVALNETRRTLQRAVGGLDWVSPALHVGNTTGHLFPKRRPYEGRVSTGGLRERLPLAAVGGLVAVLGLLLLVTTVLPGIFRGGSTPAPTQAPVDLAIAKMSVFPPNPAPGDPVSVTIQIENKSAEDSGPFKWAWYTGDPTSPDSTPTLTGEVPGLQGGTSIIVKGTYPFGGWGSFATTAFVNENFDVPETSITNNVGVRTVSTAINKAFEIDFRVLPSGDEVIDSLELAGTEFDSWHMKIAPVVDPGDAECAGAIAKISVDDVEGKWRLITGLPGRIDACKSLPMRVALAEPVGEVEAASANLEFIPTVAGEYQLDLTTADGKNILASETIRVSNADAAARKPISLLIAPRTGTLTNTQVIFTPPPDALTIIQRVILIPLTASASAPLS